MAPQIPSIEPTTFAAGETVQWDKSVPDYPNTDGWGLVYSFRGPTVFPDVTATANADGSYSVTLPAAGTGGTTALTPGTYRWAAHAVSGAGTSIQRFPVAHGVIVVTPTMVGGAELKSHAERCLEVIEAALEGRLTSDMQGYSINGRAIQKIQVRELYGLRNLYRAEVWKERNPGRSNPTRVVAFVAPR